MIRYVRIREKYQVSKKCMSLPGTQEKERLLAGRKKAAGDMSTESNHASTRKYQDKAIPSGVFV